MAVVQPRRQQRQQRFVAASRSTRRRRKLEEDETKLCFVLKKNMVFTVVICLVAAGVRIRIFVFSFGFWVLYLGIYSHMSMV